MRAAIYGVALLAIANPVALGAPALASSPSADEVIAQEKDSWRAWQTKDVAFWERHLSSDHIELDGPNGPTGKDAVVKGIGARKCSVANYNLGDFTVRELDIDTVLLVYKATQVFVCASGRISTVGWITSLYERRHGRWENVLFEHLPLKASTSTAIIRPLKEDVKRGSQ